MQRVDLDFPFGAEAPPIHCPACGTSVFDDEGIEVGKGCKHLQFVYLGDICEFLYATGPVEDLLAQDTQATEDDEDPDDDILERVVRSLQSKTGVVFSVTTGGMACGPVWSTVTIGFELHAREA